MGITEILTIIFIVLKLIGTIDWSWWLVLLPEIIGFVLYIAIYVINILSIKSLHKTVRKFNDDMRKW